MGLCISKNILKYIARRGVLNLFYNGVLQNIYMKKNTNTLLSFLLHYLQKQGPAQVNSFLRKSLVTEQFLT